MSPDPIFTVDGHWFFWDETWSVKHGPFATETEARTTLAAYAAQELEGERWTGPLRKPLVFKHTKCGREVSIAVLRDDVAMYVFCEFCSDLVEDGELDPPVNEAQIRLHVDRQRVRLMDGPATGMTTEPRMIVSDEQAIHDEEDITRALALGDHGDEEED